MFHQTTHRGSRQRAGLALTLGMMLATAHAPVAADSIGAISVADDAPVVEVVNLTTGAPVATVDFSGGSSTRVVSDVNFNQWTGEVFALTTDSAAPGIGEVYKWLPATGVSLVAVLPALPPPPMSRDSGADLAVFSSGAFSISPHDSVPGNDIYHFDPSGSPTGSTQNVAGGFSPIPAVDIAADNRTGYIWTLAPGAVGGDVQSAAPSSLVTTLEFNTGVSVPVGDSYPTGAGSNWDNADLALCEGCGATGSGLVAVHGAPLSGDDTVVLFNQATGDPTWFVPHGASVWSDIADIAFDKTTGDLFAVSFDGVSVATAASGYGSLTLIPGTPQGVAPQGGDIDVYNADLTPVLEVETPDAAGTSPASLHDTVVDFGAVRVGTSAGGGPGGPGIRVKNTGDPYSALQGSIGASTAPGGPFAPDGPQPLFAPGVLGGQSVFVPMSYTPTTRGISDVESSSVGTDGGFVSLSLEGEAVGPVFDASVDPSLLISIGSTAVGDTGTFMLHLGNLSTDLGFPSTLTDLSMLGLSLGGPDAGLFSATLPVAFDGVLSEMESTSLVVDFHPVAAGTFSAVLTLTTDQNAPYGTAGDVFSWNIEGIAFAPSTPGLPEPASLALLATGLLGAGIARRRRRRL